MQLAARYFICIPLFTSPHSDVIVLIVRCVVQCVKTFQTYLGLRHFYQILPKSDCEWGGVCSVWPLLMRALTPLNLHYRWRTQISSHKKIVECQPYSKLLSMIFDEEFFSGAIRLRDGSMKCNGFAPFINSCYWGIHWSSLIIVFLHLVLFFFLVLFLVEDDVHGHQSYLDT